MSALALVIPTDAPWMEKAAPVALCVVNLVFPGDPDNDLWFPSDGFGITSNSKVTRLRIARAKNICKACPLQLPCAEWAIEHDPPAGIFGGLDVAERRLIRRSRTRHTRSVTPPNEHGTYSTYLWHRRVNTEPCAPCIQAGTQYTRKRRAEKKKKESADE
jgi:WhiB family redox-sensing transcriptional regulator